MAAGGGVVLPNTEKGASWELPKCRWEAESGWLALCPLLCGELWGEAVSKGWVKVVSLLMPPMVAAMRRSRSKAPKLDALCSVVRLLNKPLVLLPKSLPRPRLAKAAAVL